MFCYDCGKKALVVGMGKSDLNFVGLAYKCSGECNSFLIYNTKTGKISKTEHPGELYFHSEIEMTREWVNQVVMGCRGGCANCQYKETDNCPYYSEGKWIETLEEC